MSTSSADKDGDISSRDRTSQPESTSLDVHDNKSELKSTSSHDKKSHKRKSKHKEQRKDKKKDKKSSKKLSKKSKDKKRKRDSSSSSESSSSNGSGSDDDAPRSSITGKKIRLQREVSIEDRMMEIEREVKRQFMNSQY